MLFSFVGFMVHDFMQGSKSELVCQLPGFWPFISFLAEFRVITRATWRLLTSWHSSSLLASGGTLAIDSEGVLTTNSASDTMRIAKAAARSCCWACAGHWWPR